MHGSPYLALGNVVKCFCALVVAVKRSADELLMRYFLGLVTIKIILIVNFLKIID